MAINFGILIVVNLNTEQLISQKVKRNSVKKKKCEEIMDNKTLLIKNKTNKKKHNKKINSIDSCKPFVALSILFLLVSSTLTGLFIYFYVSSWSKKDFLF